MSAKRKATAIMQHHKENISTPEPVDLYDDENYSSALLKDADKLKLMLLAWNYNLQQQAQAAQAQAQAQAQPSTAGLSSNNSSTTSTASTVGTPVTSQSTISTANNTINNSALTESRNSPMEVGEMPAGPSASGLSAAVGTEDMATLWASYAMGLKKASPPAPPATPSRSDRDRECSPPGGEGSGSVHDETSSSGNKEDEDDDDEDSDEKLDPRHHDPERLKAFNMFVRLFVDENLDRIVPISKQPKEKIQAIIDSCTRQFPEFAERARKRIRTYLKSCRRNKRGREGAPWDAVRPTPAHLTSVQAEQILATACENESDNAKRMRLGLEPVSQPMPTIPVATQTDVRSSFEHFTSTPVKTLPVKREDTPPASTSVATLTSLANLSSTSSAPLALVPTSKLLTSTDNRSHISQATIVSSTVVNGVANGGTPTAVYRPNFSQAFQRTSAQPTVTPTLSAGLHPTHSLTGLLSNGLLSNGPTDLSMRSPLLTHRLNPTELNAVRHLISGYRESATFLLKSADELETLLHNQQP